MHVSIWCWVSSEALAFILWDLLLAFSFLMPAFFIWHPSISWRFCLNSSNIVERQTIGVTFVWKKCLVEIGFVLTGGHFSNFFSLAILSAVHPARFLEREIRVGGVVLDFAAEDACFVAWKAMSCGKCFFPLARRTAIFLAMNSSLLVTVGEGVVRDQVDVGWVTWEFVAEGGNIFVCRFSGAQEIAISWSKKSLHCCIVRGIVSVWLVFAGVKNTGGGLVFVVVFIIISGGVIVIVLVNVGWFASGVLPETGQWGTGSGFGVVIVVGGS